MNIAICKQMIAEDVEFTYSSILFSETASLESWNTALFSDN